MNIFCPRILRFRQQNFCRRYNASTSPSNLLLLDDILTVEEEEIIIQITNKMLSRKKYEGNHWDDVIIKYKEVDFGLHLGRLDQNDPNTIRVLQSLDKVKERIREVLNRPAMEFQSPHVIDLAPDGWIGPHIDSIKFSGDLVAGLSLGAERTMVMTKNNTDGSAIAENRRAEYDNLPERYEFPLKRRSVYLMTGLWRYNYNHEITRAIESAATSSRRISIIFRNEKHSDFLAKRKW